MILSETKYLTKLNFKPTTNTDTESSEIIAFKLNDAYTVKKGVIYNVNTNLSGDFVIPTGVNTIAEEAFINCINLINIKIFLY